MATALILRSTYERRILDVDSDRVDDVEPDGSVPVLDWYGTFTIELDVSDGAFPIGSRLALWCTMLLQPTDVSNVRIVEKLAGRMVVEPLDRSALDTTGTWTIDAMRSTFPARHANDGPESAYVILPSGECRPVEVHPTTSTTTPSPQTTQAPSRAESVSPDVDGNERFSLVPYPTRITRASNSTMGGRRSLQPAPMRGVAEAAWRSIADLSRRLGGGSVVDGDADHALTVDVEIERGGVDDGSYRLELDGTRANVRAGSTDGVRSGLITLAQWARSGIPASATVEDRPALAVRGVHLDLARQWYEPDVVSRLIDLAAWRKLNRVHLHLTDDEAWRFPVAEHPELADVGGTRGHGLPLPPLYGSSHAPTGRAYTTSEIERWVRQADQLGITLVPEVDIPGHCHAALTAIPALRDPDDTSSAVSIQGYVNNVLVPGHPATMQFVAAVFGSLADLFPTSPILHIGGDEVPDGAWAGSPLASAYAAARGIDTKVGIELAFHREAVDVIRATTGRDVAMWQEAALAGLRPAGYAVAWTSVDAGHELAKAGHDVVMAPGQAFYLDMAPDRDWQTPGASWAGNVTLDQTCAFDPTAGWDPAWPGRLAGVQACIWSEHVHGLDALDRLVFPRLDAVAERGWTGTIVGGPAAIERRARHQPRFAT